MVNTIERVFVMVGMIIGTCMYTYLIGAVTGIVQTMNQNQQDFYNRCGTTGRITPF